MHVRFKSTSSTKEYIIKEKNEQVGRNPTVAVLLRATPDISFLRARSFLNSVARKSLSEDFFYNVIHTSKSESNITLDHAERAYSPYTAACASVKELDHIIFRELRVVMNDMLTHHGCFLTSCIA